MKKITIAQQQLLSSFSEKPVERRNSEVIVGQIFFIDRTQVTIIERFYYLHQNKCTHLANKESIIYHREEVASFYNKKRHLRMDKVEKKNHRIAERKTKKRRKNRFLEWKERDAKR